MPTITPNYGSVLNFGIRTFDVENNDGYAWQQFEGTNPIDVEFNVILNNQTLSEAEDIALTIQSLSGENYFSFVDDSKFFKDMSMSFDDFRIDFAAKNAYNARLKFSQRNEAPDLNLFSKYLKKDFIKVYATGYAYKDGDVIYDEYRATLSSGSNYSIGFSGASSKKCFYYCTKDHVALDRFAKNNTNLVQNILPIEFEEDLSAQFSSRETSLNFRASFDQRIANSTIKNIRTENISVSFDNLSDLKAKQLLHFCEHRAGSRRFEANVPTGVFRDGKVFSIAGWSQKWNYENSNTVSLSLAHDAKYKNFIESPDLRGGLVRPLLILDPAYIIDPRFNTVTGIAGKITGFVATTPNGPSKSNSNLTVDNFRMFNGLMQRPSPIAGFNFHLGGIEFPEQMPNETSIAMLVKPITKASPTHVMTYAHGVLLNLVKSGSTVGFYGGSVQTETNLIPHNDGWISIVLSINRQEQKLSIFLRNQDGDVAKASGTTNFGVYVMKIMDITVGGIEFVGDVKYVGMYKRFLSENEAAGLAGSLINSL